MTEQSRTETPLKQDTEQWKPRGLLLERLKAEAERSLVWSVRYGVRAAFFFVAYKLIVVVFFLLVDAPVQQGAKAGANALAYVNAAIATGYLPAPDKDGNLAPRPKPSPSPSSSPGPEASPSAAPSPKAAKK